MIVGATLGSVFGTVFLIGGSIILYKNRYKCCKFCKCCKSYKYRQLRKKYNIINPNLMTITDF
jgi:hypothetical protein